MVLFVGSIMSRFLICHIYFVSIFVTATVTFTCPSLFNWYPDTNNCSKFYRCVWGRSQSFTCPEGTLWSHEFLTCDFEDHVKCSTGSKKQGQSGEGSPVSRDENSPDFSVDYEFDLQPLKDRKLEGSKTRQETAIHNKKQQEKARHDKKQQETTRHSKKQQEGKALYCLNRKVHNRRNDINPGNEVKNKRKTVDDYSDVIQSNVDYEHQHNSRKNSQPNTEYSAEGETPLNKDNIDNKWTSHINTIDYSEDNEDDTTDYDLNYSYKNTHYNNHLDKEQVSRNNKISNNSDKHPLQQLLGTYLPTLEQTFQHQKSKPKRYYDGVSPPTRISQKPHYTSLDSARIDLYTKLILSKLLQLPLYSNDLDKKRNFINTDGTYDVVDIEKFPAQNGRNVRYELYDRKTEKSRDSWPFTDLFRAGYGYKRIYHKI